jgi:hypothetical protein
MVLSSYLGAVALLFSAAMGKEMAASDMFTAEQLEQYASGAVHESIMETKMVRSGKTFVNAALTNTC